MRLFFIHELFDFSSTKGHSLCKQYLHDLQFKKTRYPSWNFSKLARADISCQFQKTRYLCRHCLQNEWTWNNNLEHHIIWKFYEKLFLFSYYSRRGKTTNMITNLSSSMNSFIISCFIKVSKSQKCFHFSFILQNFSQIISRKFFSLGWKV